MTVFSFSIASKKRRPHRTFLLPRMLLCERRTPRGSAGVTRQVPQETQRHPAGEKVQMDLRPARRQICGVGGERDALHGDTRRAGVFRSDRCWGRVICFRGGRHQLFAGELAELVEGPVDEEEVLPGFAFGFGGQWLITIISSVSLITTFRSCSCSL